MLPLLKFDDDSRKGGRGWAHSASWSGCAPTISRHPYDRHRRPSLRTGEGGRAFCLRAYRVSFGGTCKISTGSLFVPPDLDTGALYAWHAGRPEGCPVRGWLIERNGRMLEKTLPLLVIVLLGFGFKQLTWVQQADGRILNTLLMTLVVPATILTSLSQVVIKPGLLLLPLAGIMVVLTLLGLGFLLAPLLGLAGGTRGAFLIAFPTLECGSIGYAVMSAAFGSRGLTAIVLFDLGQTCCLVLLIPVLASLLGQRGEPLGPGTILKQVTHTPLVWAFGLMSLGAGLGALGCITCSWFLNRHAGALVAQRGGPLSTTQRGPAHTRRSSPPDATSRRTDELVAPDAQHFLNGWCSSLWDEERYQKMSQRETGHLRQRLQTLHFSSTADTREAAEEIS